MTIKDVEKITGLTSKSIRYYEDKGLIAVDRNEENAYRNYTEENVMQLKWIKLYRYLGCSVEEIKELQQLEGKDFSNRLTQKMETLDDEIMDLETKKTLLASLIKDHEKGKAVVDEYDEAVEFWESEEMDELRDELKEAGTPSLPMSIFLTLISGAPIVTLFANIARQFYVGITINCVAALICVVLIFITWQDYFKKRKYHKKRMKEKGEGQVIMFPLLILLIVATLEIFAWIQIGTEEFLAPEGMLFWQTNDTWLFVMIIAVMAVPLSIFVLLLKKFLPNSIAGLDFFYLDGIYKHPVIAIVIWLAVMYSCIMQVTFVTEDSIVTHTPFCPQGKTYSYEDVEKVDARFGTKNFAFADYKVKGEFSYTVYLGDKEIRFYYPTANEDIERYMEHTYLELEEFDEKLVKLGVEKISSEECYEYCDMDKEYVDRFRKIINNK